MSLDTQPWSKEWVLTYLYQLKSQVSFAQIFFFFFFKSNLDNKE